MQDEREEESDDTATTDNSIESNTESRCTNRKHQQNNNNNPRKISEAKITKTLSDPAMGNHNYTVNENTSPHFRNYNNCTQESPNLKMKTTYRGKIKKWNIATLRIGKFNKFLKKKNHVPYIIPRNRNKTAYLPCNSCFIKTLVWCWNHPCWN